MIAFAAMLSFAAVAALMLSEGVARRVYLAFACLLYMVLGAAGALDARLAGSVALIVVSLAPAMLATALRPVAPAAVLPLAAACGIGAAMTGLLSLAFAPLLVSAAAMMLVRPGSVRIWASSLALVASAASFAAPPAFFAFSAAALLGTVLALKSEHLVAKQRRRSARDGVSIPR